MTGWSIARYFAGGGVGALVVAAASAAAGVALFRYLGYLRRKSAAQRPR